jgi:hypothetical protein
VIQRGDFVDYCIAEGEYRPALVVREWPGSPCLQLQVFVDKSNDGADPLGFDWFRSSAVRGDVAGTWRDLPHRFVVSTVPPPPSGAPAMPFQPFTPYQPFDFQPRPWAGGAIELKPNAAGVYETAASATR